MADSRAKILLVDLPSVSPNELNLGLANLAAWLRLRGHEARVLDLNSLAVPGSRRRRLAEALEWNPDVVGVSLFPACTATYEGAVRVLNEVRARTGGRCLRVAGGIGISIDPFNAAAKLAGAADLCAYGEGEITLAEIVERRLGGGPLAGIPGTVRYEHGEPVQEPFREFIRDLDALPFPAYDAFDSVGPTLAEYPMMTSRGCPFNCIFCLNKTLTRRTFRARSAENVIAEIEHAADRYRFDALYIWDDHFSLDRQRAEKICRMMIERKLNLRWYLPDGIRADSVTPEFAALLRRAAARV